jgi:alkanesulfonate monooxygenase SsuD/methylene tetrahydromethanopterin reductase-like flavin-dependent oxidoreductase (luciferase family)
MLAALLPVPTRPGPVGDDPPEGAADEVRLRLCVAKAVVPIAPREPPFQLGVPSRELHVGTECISEDDVLAPEVAVALGKREMDDATPLFAPLEVEPAGDVADRPSLEAGASQPACVLDDVVEARDCDHHIEHGFRGKARNGRAANVLDAQREFAECRLEANPLEFERLRPARVGIHDDDRLHQPSLALGSALVRLALMIEGQEGVTWRDWVALAETCEANGVEALFRSDHYLSGSDESRPVLDAWATISALAAHTTKLQLGTLVSPVTFRQPAILARNAATADEISGGRVTVGIGAGWMEREHEAYGFEFFTARERVERLAEYLEIVHRLLRDDRVDLDGEHYRLQNAPGFNRPNLPILVGGSALPGTTEPAARFADEYNTFFVTVEEARDRKQRLDEVCDRAGRDPATLRYSLMAPCVLGASDAAVRRSAERIAERFGRNADTVLERYGERGPVGTVEQVVARLREIEEIGYERVMLQHLVHDDLDTVALVGRELAPAVA